MICVRPRPFSWRYRLWPTHGKRSGSESQPIRTVPAHVHTLLWDSCPLADASEPQFPSGVVVVTVLVLVDVMVVGCVHGQNL